MAWLLASKAHDTTFGEAPSWQSEIDEHLWSLVPGRRQARRVRHADLDANYGFDTKAEAERVVDTFSIFFPRKGRAIRCGEPGAGDKGDNVQRPGPPSQATPGHQLGRRPSFLKRSTIGKSTRLLYEAALAAFDG